jgi:arabinan endo-1,5-alpha-L-arabinosidase
MAILRRLPGPLLRASIGALLVAGPARAEHYDVRVHDPVMVEQNGTYYVFHTGRGVGVLSSDDMQTWEPRPPAFQEPPGWATETVPRFRGSLWAPDISYHDGTYTLYYSASSFGSNDSAIGVATNTTLDPDDPDYAWVDHGPVVRSVRGRDLWNAIDPNLVLDDQGTPWLSFGSFWSGIKLVRLSEDRLSLARPQEWHTIAARNRYWKLPEADAGDTLSSAIEAPFIFKKDGWYYLFVSWDRCCAGAESTYKVVVGRSRDVTGPYLDREGEDMRFGGGSLVVRGGAAWAGVGHNSAYTFDGTDYLVFHGYDVGDEGRPKLWIEQIEWDRDAWPRVTLDAETER